MSQSQQRTHKWKPPIGHRVLSNLVGKNTPHNLALILGETQASVSTAMYHLYESGVLKRIQCPCGRGFIYWK